MTIHPNGVATTGSTHHAVWCRDEGLVHDSFMARFLERLVIGRGIKRVIQGGAHIGTLTRPLLDLGCKVLAFEPNSSAVGCLRRNCPSAELMVYVAALGDFVGKVRLHVDEENAGATWVERYPTGGIPAWTIDWFDLHPDLILADCEGHEPKILRGALATIARCRPALVLEVNAGALERVGESRDGLLALIDELNYSREIIQPGLGWDEPQYDVLALPR